MFTLAFLVAASLYLTWNLYDLATNVTTLVKMGPRIEKNKVPLDAYSLVGRDHPRRLPVEEKLVRMTVQESVHYDILAPESVDEWLWTGSPGDGHIRIGDTQQRMFAVAMFHELHCLRAIRTTIEQGWNHQSKARQGHITHCFNYLRQYTLCAADTTLEEGNFEERNFTKERVGATHTCVDWKPAYDYMNERWHSWETYRVEHDIPEHNDVT
ncbi:hypothetical protein CPB83DRAFT_767300 [Crepidotus variabilis]|uniref:Uncharacterized protein n=1 Tax=Crepidotus variabilis TaxID=179855 RepID=A0A9P6JPX3_9AGAR|nr:hypothetical protein CPB83DRAFT_767300 [Crepidotus variabilis]